METSLFSQLPSTQFSGYRLQTRSQALTSSQLLDRLCGEMEDPKNEVGSPKHKLRPLTKGFLMEFFSWYALFPQFYVMFLRDLVFAFS